MRSIRLTDGSYTGGRATRSILVVLLATVMCFWGIVPSFNVYAEDPQQGQVTTQAAGSGDEAAKEDQTGSGDASNTSQDQNYPEDPDVQQSEDGQKGPEGNGKEDISGEGTAVDTSNEQGSEETQTDAAARIGDKEFATLQEAIDAAEDGQTVELLKDTSESVEVKRVKKDMTLTIDLGGHTLRPADPSQMVIYVNYGKDITLKNGKITGYKADGKTMGAVHVLSDKATIEDVEFTSNKGAALSAHYAVAMYDDYHFEKREITVNDCEFYYNGKREGEMTWPAVYMSGYSASFDKCSFYKNDKSLIIFSQTPDNDIEVKYSIRNTRFSYEKGTVIDAGVPAGGDMDLYNVYINNNDINEADESLLYFHGVGTGRTEGGSTSLNWCKIYENSGAKHTILTDTPSSLSLYGTTIEKNTAEETGAIRAMNGYVILNNYNVIRNNSATGSGDRACGGISMQSVTTYVHNGEQGADGNYERSGGGSVFCMYGGGLYDNTSENAEFKATDLYVAPGSISYPVINPEKFQGYEGYTDLDKDFTGYSWIEQKGNKVESTPATSSNKTRVYRVDKESEEQKARRAAEAVYIDGTNGSDDGDGTRQAPVKTFAKAKEILEANGAQVIYVIGKVTVSGDEEWSLPEGTRVEREKDYKGICVEVGKDGKLDLKDITIDGGLENGAANNSSLIKVIGKLNIEEGTLLQNNDIGSSGSQGTLADVGGTLDIKGGTLKGGEIATGSAGAVYLRSGAVCNMTGGTICDTVITDATSRNDTAAVVLRSNSTFNMSGGSIENNVSEAKLLSSSATSFQPQLSSGGISVEYNATVNISGDAVLKNNESAAGGAIFMQNSSIVNISGGTFEGNKARRNGGAIIVAGLTPKLTVTGGTFKENEAEDQGGAIWTYGTDTVVTGGKFINNKATRYGGAIALAEYNGSFITLKNAIIRNNTASIAGGGVWICPVGSVVFDGEEGVAIYDNTAKGAGDDFVSVPNAGSTWSGVTQRKFGVYLSDTTLADQRVGWYRDGGVSFAQQGLGSVDSSVPRFDPNNPGERILVRGTTRSGLSLKSVISDEGKAVLNSLAETDRGVLFEGNHAYRGGAIGGNSNVINTEEYENPKEEELRVTKYWADNISEEDIPEEITVNLKLDDKVIDTLVLKKSNGWEGKFNGLVKEHFDDGRYSVEEVKVKGMVASYSDISWQKAPTREESEPETGTESGEELDNDKIEELDQDVSEDLTHVWFVFIENSREPEVKEEIEEPDEPPVPEGVKPAEEEPKKKAKASPANSNGGTNTGDSAPIALMIAMMLAAAAVPGIRRIGSRQANKDS